MLRVPKGAASGRFVRTKEAGFALEAATMGDCGEKEGELEPYVGGGGAGQCLQTRRAEGAGAECDNGAVVVYERLWVTGGPRA